MTAQPIEDPDDPQAILRRLPEHERGFFEEQYRAQVEAARNPAGYRQLRAFLHAWSVRAAAVGRPGRGQEQPQGDDAPVSIEQAIADAWGIPLDRAEAYWSHRVAAAAARRGDR